MMIANQNSINSGSVFHGNKNRTCDCCLMLAWEDNKDWLPDNERCSAVIVFRSENCSTTRYACIHADNCPHNYQYIPTTAAVAPTANRCCHRGRRRRDSLDVCGSCGPGPGPDSLQLYKTNCSTVCDLSSCRQISLGVSVNNARTRLSSPGRSKFFSSVKSQLFVHVLVSLLLFRLISAPTLVSGLSSSTSTSTSSNNQTFQPSDGGGSSSFEGFENIGGISSGGTTTNYKGRENAIRREPNFSYTPSGCHSCRLREQVKADNLASIKRHILLRLELKTPPNITSPMVPREIIEKFYKSHHMFNHSVSSGSTGVRNGGDTTTTTTTTLVSMNANGSPGNRHSPSYDSMQGDDPRTYIDYAQNSEENESEDYEEEFFSVINSLYVFPTMPRMRHNRKPDILHFSFTNNGHSSVSQALLHLYIRGRDWIREFEPNLLNGDGEFITNNRQDIVLTVNRVLRRQNSPNSTHTQKVNEVRHHIPNGFGSWITIDITEMVTNWFNNPNTNHGLVIKTLESWMKPIVVTDDNPSNKAYALYIEIQTKDNRKRRTKRNTSLNCSESDNEERCCRYPLEVDFRKFDWDWIVAPTSFNAYFCNGECKLGFLPKYPHTHLMQLSTAPQPCCSPTKMSPIKLLYFNNDRNLVMSTIPNMAVDKCSCS